MKFVSIKMVFLFIGIFFLMLLLNSCAFSSRASKRLYDQAAKEQFDMVIVPGVPFVNGKWDRIMKGRVYWSKFLFEKGIAKNLMFSGAAVYSPYTEAGIMSLYAEAIGIPKENVFLETKAEHSTENAYYSYKKAIELGFKKIGIASDPFQTKMLKSFARKKLSPDLKLIPFVYDTLKMLEPEMKDPAIDYAKYFVKDFIPLTKREGFWKRFRGTLGKNIDYNADE
ncbi:MAG: YdcF family protein [Bacteroidetes bacterium]|nr:YdcF family protein [Bacteroidota bacterium]